MKKETIETMMTRQEVARLENDLLIVEEAMRRVNDFIALCPSQRVESNYAAYKMADFRRDTANAALRVLNDLTDRLTTLRAKLAMLEEAEAETTEENGKGGEL